MSATTGSHPELELLTGPMFAGKTEALIDVVVHERSLGREVAVFTPVRASCHENMEILSHAGRSLCAEPFGDANRLLAVRSAEVVAVDEAQFADPEIVDVLATLRRRGAHIISAALNRNFLGRPFTATSALRTAADVVHELRAVCTRCGRPASYTQRIEPSGHTTFSGEIIEVGGAERYQPRCGTCFEAPPIIRHSRTSGGI